MADHLIEKAPSVDILGSHLMHMYTQYNNVINLPFKHNSFRSHSSDSDHVHTDHRIHTCIHVMDVFLSWYQKVIVVSKSTRQLNQKHGAHRTNNASALLSRFKVPFNGHEK